MRPVEDLKLPMASLARRGTLLPGSIPRCPGLGRGAELACCEVACGRSKPPSCERAVRHPERHRLTRGAAWTVEVPRRAPGRGWPGWSHVGTFHPPALTPVRHCGLSASLDAAIRGSPAQKSRHSSPCAPQRRKAHPATTSPWESSLVVHLLQSAAPSGRSDRAWWPPPAHPTARYRTTTRAGGSRCGCPGSWRSRASSCSGSPALMPG
mmetsp:Transcript_70291/g.194437  ORF Transcript_70291/g.194437 Transcript_70291/m.194437 type:complete len:209 (+) Transcript_70291:411-1037(+)